MSSLQLHVLSAGRLSMRKSVYIPGAAREEMIELPVLSFLLRHPQGNVLFDTGCHPDAATDPQGRWGGMSRIMRMVSPPQVSARSLSLTARPICASMTPR